MDLIITLLPVVTKGLPISTGSRLTIFLSRCKFSNLTTGQPIMVVFYLLTFPRFPLRKKEHKSYFGKNQTHDFRTTSRCAGYLLDHSGDEAFFQSFHFRATYNSDESSQRFSFHATKPIEGYFLEKSPKNIG